MTDKLKEIQLQMLLGKMAESGARKFFAEHDLPPELVDGWKNYQRRVTERQRAGYPMPPGGTFVMGRESVWAGCMAEFHTALSNMLGVPPEKIKLRIDATGTPKVIADIEMEALPEIKIPGEDPAVMAANKEQYLKLYLEQTVDLLNRMFRHHLSERLRECETIRKDVAQEVVSRATQEEAN